MNEAATSPSSAVDGGELMRHCVEFAKRVKLSGTPDELESFRYLKSCLDAYGYRTELLSHDAYISLPGRSRVEADGRELDSITHSFSLPSPAGGLTAALVDVGDGTRSGFRQGGLPRQDRAGRRHREPRGRGARQGGGRHRPASYQSARASARDVHLAGLGQPFGRDARRDAHDRRLHHLARAMAKRCERGSRRAASSRSCCTPRWIPAGARRRSWSPSSTARRARMAPFVLFSGHHDTWYYGVMDNGSANATMLEAARLMRRAPRALAAGLRICFWSGHSHGRYSGSAWYADTAFGRSRPALRRACERRFDRRHRRRRCSPRTASCLRARAVAKEAIAAEAGQNHAGNAHRGRASILLGHRHSLDVWQHQPSAARAGEDAQRARLVVAHAA